MGIRRINMQKNLAIALYVIVMVGIILALDVTVFRHHLGARLLVNIGIVLVFVAFYFVLFKHS